MEVFTSDRGNQANSGKNLLLELLQSSKSVVRMERKHLLVGVIAGNCQYIFKEVFYVYS
ncbi:hypothetical protein [Nostoc sp. FACHB-110]|uniref:hypothetical protein n=1 Tax=Nostoc sp. FACHB-110 TaxID=2692834 RepID=UPI0016897975|nr:hypothetical protein [Nostoc sp. FACHB-110]MBD2440301.1 hypothetical protein [Nostoc sp. FACHB-110]